jgi:class 3 adenylate cyclase
MAEAPSGPVTLLFTDIEGSTRLLQRAGDAYADLLEDHRRLLRAAFERHGGYEVDTEGDAFFVAFSSANGAVAAATEAQQALARPLGQTATRSAYAWACTPASRD